jgi:serine/threonine-protein kinase
MAAARPLAPAAERPVVIGRYRALERIGAGSSGLVMRGHDPLIGRDVALKIIRVDRLSAFARRDYMARFRVEAQAGGRCNHPAIVAIHDAGEEDGVPYLVMEYVAGRSLAAILADPAARAALDPMALMEDMLGALGYAHARGILHRDIKPANIIITPEGRAKVADFGIARLDNGEQTLMGELMGTPTYMAPEQAHGETPDPRSDLFSAAAIFFAVLTGDGPFAGRNVTETLMRLMSAEAADLSALRGAQARFIPVLRKALAKVPAERFADAAAFAAALRGAVTQSKLARWVAAEEPAPVPWAGQAERIVREDDQAAKPPARPAMLDGFVQRLAEPDPDSEETMRLLARAGTAQAPELEAARLVLAEATGPIAKVLIARAAADAPGQEALVDRLLEAVPAAEKAKFRTRLWAALTR